VASDRFSVVTSVPISFSGSDPIISSTPSSSLVDSNLSDNRFYFLYFASSESVAEASGDVSFSVLRQFRCGLSSKISTSLFYFSRAGGLAFDLPSSFAILWGAPCKMISIALNLRSYLSNPGSSLIGVADVTASVVKVRCVVSGRQRPSTTS
jgi:hypothetical protein